MVNLKVASNVMRATDVNRHCVSINTRISNNRLNHIGLGIGPATCLRGQCRRYRRIKRHIRSNALIHRLIEAEGHSQCRGTIRIRYQNITDCRGSNRRRIHRVDGLQVVNSLNQRVASNINNAVIHRDRDILHAVIRNSHSHSRCGCICVMRYRVALSTGNRQITLGNRLYCL